MSSCRWCIAQSTCQHSPAVLWTTHVCAGGWTIRWAAAVADDEFAVAVRVQVGLGCCHSTHNLMQLTASVQWLHVRLPVMLLLHLLLLLCVCRIGFGAATRTPVLVDRTKAEVAGTLLTAQLALQHGLACNTAGG